MPVVRQDNPLRQVLQCWLTSAKAWERERALQVCAQLLGDCEERFEVTVSRELLCAPCLSQKRALLGWALGFRSCGAAGQHLCPLLCPIPAPGSMAGRGERAPGLPATLLPPLAPAERMRLQAIWLLGGAAGTSDYRIPGHVPPLGRGLPGSPSANAR